MSTKSKLFSLVAVLAIAGAVGAAPANAAKTTSFKLPTSTSFKLPSNLKLPSVDSVGALCQTQSDPTVAAACNQLVTAAQTCSKQRGISAVLACLRQAASQFNTSGLKLPSNLKLPTNFKLPSNFSLNNISGLLGGLKL